MQSLPHLALWEVQRGVMEMTQWVRASPEQTLSLRHQNIPEKLSMVPCACNSRALGDGDRRIIRACLAATLALGFVGDPALD